MPTMNRTVDNLLQLKDAGLVASSAAATVSAVAKIIDLGAGMVEGDIILDVTAVESNGRFAQGTLTIDTNPVDGNNDTLTIGTTTYRFKGTMAQANDVKIGVDKATTQAHLVKTINGTGAAGTDYFAGTVTPCPGVTAADFSSDDCVLTATTEGTAGEIATTETFNAGTNVFDGATLGTTTAGVDADERYDIMLQGSNSATFVSGNVVLTCTPMGAAAKTTASVDSVTGRIVVPFRNEFQGTIYRYVRAYTLISGTEVAAGINYTARLAKNN